MVRIGVLGRDYPPVAGCSLPRISFNQISLTRHLGPALLAATVALGFSHDNFLSWQFRAWVILFALSIVYVAFDHRKLTAREKWPLGVILGAMLLSIPGSILWGEGHWPETLLLVAWTGPMALFFVAKHPERILWWLMPVLLAHAGLLFYQGFWMGEFRASGLTVNPNPAAALLLLGFVFAATQPARGKWWIGLPLLMAMPYTGSRWALVALLVILGVMLIRQDRARLLAVGITLALSFTLGWFAHDGLLVSNYRVSGGIPEYVYKSTRDAQARNEIPEVVPPGGQAAMAEALPVLAGVGLLKHDGLHNVPLRMASQFGVLAAAAWLWLVLESLWQRPRLARPGWWLALAVLLLAQMDYYLMMGQLAPLMWLILEMRGRV